MSIWRLETMSRSQPTQGLADGLSLHLRYASFTSVLVQIGDQQKAYVTGQGCSGCRQKRCEPTCRMALLRRMLIANAAGDMQPVLHGLSDRPYTRIVFGIPASQAQPLNAAILKPWQEARLWCCWHMLAGRPVVATGLAVGREGPDPATILRDNGWHCVSMHSGLTRFLLQPALYQLPVGGIWKKQPFLLVSEANQVSPMPTHTQPVPQSPAIAPETLLQASQHLAQILENMPVQMNQTIHSHIPDAQVPQQAANQPGFEEIPARFRDTEHMHVLLTRIATSEAAQNGLSIARIRKLADLSRHEAAMLLCWLELANLIAPPRNPAHPWRELRPLITTDIPLITTQLHAASVPSREQLAAAFQSYQETTAH